MATAKDLEACVIALRVCQDKGTLTLTLEAQEILCIIADAAREILVDLRELERRMLIAGL